MNPRSYDQAAVDTLLAEHQAQIAMLSERCANYALANRALADRLAAAEAMLKQPAPTVPEGGP